MENIKRKDLNKRVCKLQARIETMEKKINKMVDELLETLKKG